MQAQLVAVMGLQWSIHHSRVRCWMHTLGARWRCVVYVQESQQVGLAANKCTEGSCAVIATGRTRKVSRLVAVRWPGPP